MTPSTSVPTASRALSHPGRPRLRVPLLLLVLLGALVAAAVPAPPVSAAALAIRTPSRTIETYARYQPQSTCSPQAKPGVLAFTRLVLRAYPGTGSSGIVRACSIGGRSEHKEGRAWDWRLSVHNPRQRQQASDMAAWLFATDRYGNRRAMARRLGLMYVIWNHKIWSAERPGAGWRPYGGPNPHTDHMHFSFSVLGAQGKTSFWSGSVPASLRTPTRPAPAPRPGPTHPAPHPTAPVVTPTFPDDLPAPSIEPEAPVDTSSPVPVPTASAPSQPVLDKGTAQVRVPADGTRVTSAFALRAGRRYELSVTGTYQYGDGSMQADAECSRWPRDRFWHRTSQWEGSPGRGHLDLQVTGSPEDWTPATDTGGGCNRADHTYTRTVLAASDAPLSLRLDDDFYGDNRGGLTVLVTVLDSAVAVD